jgi:hypothetical protein
MHLVLKIKTSKINQFTIRELSSKVWLFILPILIALSISYYMDDYSTVIEWVMILVFLFSFSFYIKKEYVKSYRYKIDSNKIKLDFDLNETAIIPQIVISFIRARNKRRFGISEGRTINYTEISSIILKEKEIVIKTKENSLLTNNGKMRIPSEIEEFEKVSTYFRRIKSTENNS